MKSSSAPLVALINSKAFFSANCYTFSLATGVVVRLTAADFDVVSGGFTWTIRPRIEAAQNRPTAHWKMGLDVDSWTATILPRAADEFTGAPFPDRIGDEPFLAYAAAGGFSGAEILVERAFFAAPGPAWPLSAAARTPVGMLTLFKGLVGEVNLTSSAVAITAQDYRVLLSTQMPRNLYQASCLNQLFDARCALSSGPFARTGTVGDFSTRSIINAAVASPGGSGTWVLGRMVFSSGRNSGQQRMVADWDGAQEFRLANPLLFAPEIGDAFTVYPGCDKSEASCFAFGNHDNFRGFSRIPTPETAL